MTRRISQPYEAYASGAQDQTGPIAPSGFERTGGGLRGVYLRSLAEARQVEYAHSVNWDMQIPDAPAPFNNWFPSTEYDRSLGAMDSFPITVGGSTFEIPQGTAQKDIRLTFHDSDDLVLETWLTRWFNSVIVDPALGVATLQEACKLVRIAMLDNKRDRVRTDELWVYPTGRFNTIRDSAPNVNIHVCSFNIVARNSGI